MPVKIEGARPMYYPKIEESKYKTMPFAWCQVYESIRCWATGESKLNYPEDSYKREGYKRSE